MSPLEAEKEEKEEEVNKTHAPVTTISAYVFLSIYHILLY